MTRSATDEVGHNRQRRSSASGWDSVGAPAPKGVFDVGGAGHRVIETPPLQPNIGIPHAINLSIVRFAKYHLQLWRRSFETHFIPPPR